MQIQSQAKKRRKGISVSLTPDKKNQPNNQQYQMPLLPVVYSASKASSNQCTQLQQSYVYCANQQQPVIPNFRVFSTNKPIDNVVRFHYSNVSRQQQLKQGQVLDQELHILQKQIQNKRQNIEHMQSKPFQMASSTVTPVYTRQPHYPSIRVFAPGIKQPQILKQQIYNIKNKHAESNYPVNKPQKKINNIQQKQKIQQKYQFKLQPQPQPKFQVSSRIQNHLNAVVINEIKPIIKQTVSYNQSPQKLVQNNKKIESPKKIQNKSPEKKQAAQNQKIIEEINKKIVQKQKNKQNMIKQAQRLQRLKWAQQKLLDIIRVCDNGL